MERTLLEEPAHRRLATYIIDTIGASGINVIVFKLGPDAENGYELQAWEEETGERWTVTARFIYDSVFGDAGGV